jgi:hypothetical protein
MKFLYALWIATLATMIGLTGFGIGHAWPHDFWANGDPVPGWIKSACCGQAEAHVLGSDEYSIDSRGFHVRGIAKAFPMNEILPSQDGKVWAFYNNAGENAVIHCVFYSGAI